MPHQTPTTDVVIIGGGPAGSTVATMLARKGVQTLLLERERFPREHVGESLLPASIPVLDDLGVLPDVERAGFLPKWGATMVWGKENSPWSWYFKETNRRHPHAYQVWRPQFDELLLDNSRQHGAEVREGCRVVEVLSEQGRVNGVRYHNGDGRDIEVRASIVVDASGQAGILSHQLGLRQWDPFFRNLAAYAYFDGAERLPAPDAHNIFIESYPQGWLWNIPLHTGWASVGAVVDSAAGQEGIAKQGPEQFLKEQIGQAPHMAEMLAGAKLVSGPFIIKDWSYLCDRVAGDGYVLVGDAACFIDPLFSSGVHLALLSGVLAAAYVTTVLKDATMSEAAAQVYQEMYYQEYEHFRELAKLFYSSNRSADSYFWEARRLLDDRSMAGVGRRYMAGVGRRYNEDTPRQAFIRAVAGQSPRGYERAVLERGQLPPEFVQGIREVEAARERRQARFQETVSGAEPEQGWLHAWAPRLSEGSRLERKPLLGDGEFQWGEVLITPERPEGIPCGGLVAAMLSLVDGRATVAEILGRLMAGEEQSQADQVAGNVLAALRILYVEGAVEEWRGL